MMAEEKSSSENWLAPTDSSGLLGAVTTQRHLSLLIVSSLEMNLYINAFIYSNEKHD